MKSDLGIVVGLRFADIHGRLTGDVITQGRIHALARFGCECTCVVCTQHTVHLYGFEERKYASGMAEGVG